MIPSRSTVARSLRALLAVMLVLPLAEAAVTKLGAQAMLFPYQVVEGSAAKSGLREEHDGTAISRAKPVIAPAGTVIEIIREETVAYEDGTKIAVVQVKATCDGFRDRRTDAVTNIKSLEGFILARHVR